MLGIVFGAFVSVQTFFFLARQDKFEVLFWWTGESWPLVVLLWLKDLGLAALAGFLAVKLLRLTVEAATEEESARETPLRLGVEAPLVLGALGIGVVLRWIFREVDPPGLWVDTLYSTQALLRSPDGVPWLGATPFGAQTVTHELVSNLYLQFCRGVFAIFGRGETGFFAVSAVPGCLTLPALWWLAREAFGARVALFALALGALLRWPLILSRWGFTATLLVALVLLGAAAALASFRTKKLWLALLSGAAVGLAFHTHASAGALAAAFGVFGLLALRAPETRRIAVAAGAAALLALAPFASAFVSHPEWLGGHTRDVALGAAVRDADTPRVEDRWSLPVRLAINALEYTGILLWTRDPNPRHMWPDHAVTTPFVGIAAMLGFGLAARRSRPADRLLLCVTAGSLLAGILSSPAGAPNTLRTCAVLGPMAILAAATLEIWIVRAARAGACSAGVLFAGLLAFVVATETLPALTSWPWHPRVVQSFCATETETARLLRRLGLGEIVLDPSRVTYPLVIEALAERLDAATPLTRFARRRPEELAQDPPRAALWYVTSPEGFAVLRARGLRCGRGIAPNGNDPGVVVARLGP